MRNRFNLITFLLFIYSPYSSFSVEFISPGMDEKREAGDIWISMEQEKCSNIGFLDFINGETTAQENIRVYYRHVKVNESNPTLIYIPGGPGGTSITSNSFKHLENMFNILYIDPRGFGCNQLERKFETYENLKSERVADDILKIVKKENLSDIYIYGGSFGTLLGTITTSVLEGDGIYPKALILEGVIGRFYIDPAKDYTQAAVNNYNTYLKENPWLISLINRTIEIGEEPEFFFHHFARQLIANNGPLAPDEYILRKLQEFHSGSNTDLKEAINETKSFINNSTITYGNEPTEGMIECREMALLNNHYDRVWDSKNNNVTFSPNESRENVCLNHELTNPFDSKEYKLQTTIYYLQGQQDPSTPLSGARYHYDNQTEAASKYFIEIVGIGHSPFHESLHSCEIDIWSAIKDLSDLNDVLNPSGHCK